MLRQTLVLLCLLFVAASCAPRDASIIDSSRTTADALAQKIHPLVEADEYILVTSFVDLGDLNRTTDFGRLVGEQVGARLTAQGFKVKEVKMSQAHIFVREGQGEFLLSRALREISKEHSARIVIVGTYTPAFEDVYITAKAIDTTTNIVEATHAYSLPLGPNTSKLLGIRYSTPRYQNW
jgi:TolB-like protein